MTTQSHQKLHSDVVNILGHFDCSTEMGNCRALVADPRRTVYVPCRAKYQIGEIFKVALTSVILVFDLFLYDFVIQILK